MARYQYVVLTRAVEGKKDEFVKWYDGRHLADVVAVPGIVSAKRYGIVKAAALGMEVPQWDSLAIYEIDAEDPELVLDGIVKAAYTPAMPITDAMAQVGVQFLIQEVSSSG